MSTVYLEGTDGVGKTTIIAELKKEGIECVDRHKAVFSRYMLFDVPMQVRVEKYTELLKEDILIVLLINNDKAELDRRIRSRKKEISEFDRHAYEYNILYRETYEYMQEHGRAASNLIAVDLTGKTIEQSVAIVKEAIVGYGFTEGR